jgi:type II secretory pathway component PulM
MSSDRLQFLYLFLCAGALASLVWWISALPEDSRTFRVTAKVLSSWFLSARWSAEPRRRLKMMALGMAFVSLVMLWGFITNPPVRH